MLLTNIKSGAILQLQSRKTNLKEALKMFMDLFEEEDFEESEEKRNNKISLLYWLALSNINNGFRFWLLLKKYKGLLLILKEVLTMYIYDELNTLDENVEEYGVSPLAYIVLECGR